MPSLFSNQNVCYATASTSDPLTWTKQGVAIAYDAAGTEFLHSGIEPTGLIKFGSTYYLYLCSTHGTAAAALGASVMDRRAAVATSSSLSGPWTVYPLLCESSVESFQEPWLYNISPCAFRGSSASTALFYLISASGGVNGDWQQLELHESPTPLFSREYTRHIGSILVPRDEGTGFPDWEIDVVGILTDDIEKDTYAASGSELWLYFGGKAIGENWKMGLSKQSTIVKALRPPIQTRCHRYGTQLPLRAANKVPDQFADVARRRTQANVELSPYGDALSIGSLYGLIQQAQESNTEDNAGNLTVYRTDGTTELAQKSIATDGTAEPVVGIS
jgi:hypothetical protein